MPSSERRLRRRFWLEAGLAGLTGALFVLTVLWHDWLEALGLDPDHHNGSVEWLLVAALFVLCAALSRSAQVEWRRTAAAT
jgi:NADH:ubiquinone oxidoreductase subunit 5 (subunit L)/multisubunit Na+/H+ antiporter MnhA subunit